MRTRDPQFRNRCLIYGGLALATLAVYLPVLYHGFVQYDDQQYVTDNPRVQAGLTWTGLAWAFGFHAGNWHPLAWLSHMLDCQLYGAGKPAGISPAKTVKVTFWIIPFGFMPDDERNVAQRGGGGAVCVASAPR